MAIARRLIGFAIVFAMLFTIESNAAVIGFEGIAAPGTQTTDNLTNNVFSGFNVFLPHGHYQGIGFLQPSPRPGSGSDWLLHDHFSGGGGGFQAAWELTAVGGGAFSIQSFQASEWEDTFTRGNVLTVTGDLQGGGQISTTFTTDAIFGFESFFFSPAWTNLVKVSFVDLNPDTGFGKLGFDNVVVNEQFRVPEPATMTLLGLGSLILAGYRARRRQ